MVIFICGINNWNGVVRINKNAKLTHVTTRINLKKKNMLNTRHQILKSIYYKNSFMRNSRKDKTHNVRKQISFHPGFRVCVKRYGVKADMIVRIMCKI